MYKRQIQQVPDKARIQLTVWNARNPYSKEKKRSYPYLLVMDFDLAQEFTGAPNAEQGDFAPLEDEDAQLPF